MDIKQELRDRITSELSPTRPVASLNFSAQGIDLKKIMDELMIEYRANGTNITYDCDDNTNSSCRITVCNLLTNAPGRQCAIDYSIRRFKRSYMPQMAMF